MKKLLLSLMLLTTITLSAQTVVNLSGLTGNITLGSNCSSSQNPEQFVTTGDANLNQFNVNLRNASLKVNGYINGSGSFTYCGQSRLCTTMNVQNNPTIPSGLLVDCNTLGTDTFESINEIPKNLNYTVYNTIGQVISRGNTTNLDLPKYVVCILKVEGFKAHKIWLQ